MKKRTTLCSYSASEDTENTFMNVHDWIVTSFISINDLKKENKKMKCIPIPSKQWILLDRNECQRWDNLRVLWLFRENQHDQRGINQMHPQYKRLYLLAKEERNFSIEFLLDILLYLWFSTIRKLNDLICCREKVWSARPWTDTFFTQTHSSRMFHIGQSIIRFMMRFRHQ